MILAGDSLRFLVVDDDNAKALVDMIEQLGHHADQARNGVEAVGALSLESYDLMLVDLTGSRITGEDVLRWVRDHPDWAGGVRVVAISGETAQDGRGAKTVGAHAVIPKPRSAHQLRDWVDATFTATAD